MWVTPDNPQRASVRHPGGDKADARDTPLGTVDSYALGQLADRDSAEDAESPVTGIELLHVEEPD